MGTIKDRNGLDLKEAEDIKKRWQEYTEELYKKDLSFSIDNVLLQVKGDSLSSTEVFHGLRNGHSGLFTKCEECINSGFGREDHRCVLKDFYPLGSELTSCNRLNIKELVKIYVHTVFRNNICVRGTCRRSWLRYQNVFYFHQQSFFFFGVQMYNKNKELMQKFLVPSFCIISVI